MNALTSWQEEKRSAYLYVIMAANETHPLRKKLFQSLAVAAEEQAMIWQQKITPTDAPFAEVYRPDTRTHLISWLIKHMGISMLRYILPAMKIRGLSSLAFNNQLERHHNIRSAGNLRAAVFGVNDGLISNMSLVLGIAGANANHSVIVLAGIAGLLAGASSMAAGEFVSVRSQRDVYEYQIELEKKELELYPDEEREELSLIYQARGIPLEDADKLATLLINNPETALDTLTREELGLNPNELGSPVGAMIASFVAFAFGATIPIIPFLLGDYHFNLLISIGLTAFSLFIVGSLISLFTNRSVIMNGLKMLIIGSLAGGITYLIGMLLGVTLY
jgi:VIT1/CCC1 family predicted Fe2+/Mn2+ transporter